MLISTNKYDNDILALHSLVENCDWLYFWGHFGTERWVPFLHLHLGTIFYRSPKRNCRGVSMGVDLGLAFCPSAMGLDTSGHRAPGQRMGLGSSPWFPGVSLPSCAKPNKLLNHHEFWVLFLKGHDCLLKVTQIQPCVWLTLYSFRWLVT